MTCACMACVCVCVACACVACACVACVCDMCARDMCVWHVCVACVCVCHVCAKCANWALFVPDVEDTRILLPLWFLLPVGPEGGVGPKGLGDTAEGILRHIGEERLHDHPWVVLVLVK